MPDEPGRRCGSGYGHIQTIRFTLFAVNPLAGQALFRLWGFSARRREAAAPLRYIAWPPPDRYTCNNRCNYRKRLLQKEYIRYRPLGE